MERIFHIARRREWEEARRHGSYAISTRDQTLVDVGFIHCSYAHQVATTANAYYAGEADLVLLVIDPSRLAAPLRPEPPAPGAEPYPHIYGPLNVDAVVEVVAYTPAADGRFPPPPSHGDVVVARVHGQLLAQMWSELLANEGIASRVSPLSRVADTVYPTDTLYELLVDAPDAERAQAILPPPE